MPDSDDGCVSVRTFLLEHPPLTSGHSCRDRAAAWGSLQTRLSLGLHKWREVQMWKGGWRRSRPSSQSWTFLKTHKRTGTRKGGSHRPRDTKKKSHLRVCCESHDHTCHPALLWTVWSQPPRTVSLLTEWRTTADLTPFILVNVLLKHTHTHTDSLLCGAGTHGSKSFINRSFNFRNNVDEESEAWGG